LTSQRASIPRGRKEAWPAPLQIKRGARQVNANLAKKLSEYEVNLEIEVPDVNRRKSLTAWDRPNFQAEPGGCRGERPINASTQAGRKSSHGEDGQMVRKGGKRDSKLLAVRKEEIG